MLEDLNIDQEQMIYLLSEAGQAQAGLPQLLSKALEIIFKTELLNWVQSANLFLVEHNHLQAIAQYNMTSPEFSTLNLNDVNDTCKQIIKSGKIKQLRFNRQEQNNPKEHASFFCALPIMSSQQKLLGVLHLYTPHDLTNEEQHSGLNYLNLATSILATFIHQKKAEEKLARNNQLLQAMSQIQQSYLNNPKNTQFFDGILHHLLQLTDSEYGFIGRILIDHNDQKYLRTYALTDISWNQETQDLYLKNIGKGMKFQNLNTLFGAVILTGEHVISNHPESDPRSGGLPPGHPPMKCFLGVPLYYQSHLIGMAGVANTPKGYHESITEEIAPFIQTCATVIEMFNQNLRQKAQEQQHHEILQSLGEAIIVQDYEKNILFANTSAHDLFTSHSQQASKHNTPGSLEIQFKLALAQASTLSLQFAPSQEQKMSIQHPDRGKIWLSFNQSQLFQTESTDSSAHVYSFRDITSLMAYRQQLNDYEHRLNTSEANLQALFNNTTEAIWSITLENKLWSFNRVFTKLCNDFWGVKVFSGQNLKEIIPTQLWAIWLDYFEQSSRGKHISQQLTLPLENKPEFSLSLSPILQDNQIIGISAYAKDITHLTTSIRNLAQKNAELRAIFNSIPDLYIRLNQKGQILDCQGSLADHYYFSPNSQGCFLNEALPFELAYLFTEQLQAILKHQDYSHLKFSFCHEDKESFFEAIFSPLLEQQVIITIRNTTAQIQYEREIIQAREKAEQISEIKSLFLAKMSHELRTPLNSILGFTHLISKKYAPQLDQQIVTYLDKVNRNGHHLLNIINDLLDLAQIEEGKVILVYETVNLLSFIEDVALTFEPHLNDKNVLLQVISQEPQYLIKTDPLRLRQILINLIGNAVKYTSKGSILIAIAHSETSDLIQIEIKDTGPGIPKSKQSSIFEPFEQGDNSLARRYGGVGLGISICKSLSQLLGYQLFLQYSGDQGSCFVLEIPLPTHGETHVTRE